MKTQKFAEEVNRNKSVFQVYGLDENGANVIYEDAQFDGDENGLGFAEALECYNSIQLNEEGERKYLTLRVIDENGICVFVQNLMEDAKLIEA